jgi:haloalkane dehalogenase
MFHDAVAKAPVLDIGRLVAAGCVRGMSDDVRAAYDAPFPSEESKVAARAMPDLVPTRPDDPAAPANRLAWAALGECDTPFLTAFSDSDPITAGMEAILQQHVPGAAGLDHPTITNAGHFLQEDAGPELGQVVAAFIASASG